MISLNEFAVKKVSEKDNSVTFAVGPLPKGYGHTLGNFLRRILLSSIPGSAITAVKIDGVQHEYSTMSGVPDDVLAILLSMKEVVVASKVLEPVTLKIDVKGKDGAVVEVKAGDFEKNSNVDVINPEYVITKLTSGKAKFSAEITVERGVGYSLPKEELRKEISVLPLDASFTPIRLVNYIVTSARVGKETDLDQLELTIETNGSLKAEEALHIASDTINQMTTHFKGLTESLLSGDEVAVSLNEQQKKTKVRQAMEDEDQAKTPIKVVDLNLSTRLTNSLLKSGYDDLRKLEGMTEEELSNIRGMGSKSFIELLDVLKKHNIKLI